MNHTPGPWRAKQKRWSPEPAIGNQGIYDAAGNCIATVLIHTSAAAEAPRRLADARLIAAAPEMLTTLQWAAKELEQLDEATAQVVASVLLDAVLKATEAA